MPKDKTALLSLVLLLSPQPHAWTQYPPPALVGSTLGQDLRNAANATQNQLNLVRTAADDWRRRADSVGYADANLRRDLDNIQWSFQGLRTQFNWLGQLALQLGRPTANNAVAELDAGLNIIAELFVFLGDRYAAGSIDRATVARTARAFQNAMAAWEQEFRKNSSRLGLAW